MIREVHDLVASGHKEQAGALLDIVPVFLKFTGFTYTREGFDLPRFHAFFSTVMEVTHRHNGRLNRISMGDKGSTFFILFGAPNPMEKKEELACQWALDLGEAIARYPEAAVGIGLNAGRVFAGIVGGAGRSEYTVMGDAVNFAARLMQGAKDGQVCLSGSVRERAGERYAFTDLGTRRFKGKAEPLAVFALEERKKGRSADHAQPALVGRTAETAMVRAMMEKALGGEPCLCVIEGEPGVGKSCLAVHLLEQTERSGWAVAAGRGEITRRSHAYAPWREALKALFFGGAGPDRESLKALLGPEHAAYLPWHLEFFGLPVPPHLPSPTADEETRKRLFQHQLSQMILNVAAGNGAADNVAAGFSLRPDDMGAPSERRTRNADHHLSRRPPLVRHPLHGAPARPSQPFQGPADLRPRYRPPGMGEKGIRKPSGVPVPSARDHGKAGCQSHGRGYAGR